MKKQLTVFIAALTVFATAGTSAFADDDDITCTADVEWRGHVYTVTESEDSRREVKEELIEEACERACRHARDDDRCEHRCEAKARIIHMECDGDRRVVHRTVVHHEPVHHVEVHHEAPRNGHTLVIHHERGNSGIHYEFNHN